ncbi:Ferric enterobactin transport system permease protein FepD [Clavibacter michiganensis]|uniref:Ferric enterobactin transport system permease protein FepD n=1 Tax=Clavibacter michiganensis TaxID=28447 RepID=A0A251XWF8_9MICO|nr:Ferric enterobactin transport system permease protein FepD [Clavibacter michiganensis]
MSRLRTGRAPAARASAPIPRPATVRARRRARTATWAIAVAVALAGSLVLSLAVGANGLTPGLVLATLAGGGTDESRFVLLDQRIPRTLLALAVGVGLGGAGALMQALTRNPLADPGILGVNAGAAAAVAGAVVLVGVTDPAGQAPFAYAGALVLTVVVVALGTAGRGRADPVRLTLAGIAVGAVLSGITTGVTLTHPEAFERMLGWSAGTLLGRDLTLLPPVLPLLGAGVLLAVAIAPALDAVALGDDTARSQGVSLPRTRLVTIAAVTLLAGTATALAGPVSFVGLMIPHVVRWSLGWATAA